MELKHFKKIYVEITNVCNLRCSFCSACNRDPGFMPLTLFAEVIKKIHKHTNYICLHVKGEPLLHPQLIDMLDICHEYKLRVALVTNGILLSDKSEMLLSKSALRQINISLHCYPEIQNSENKNNYIKEVIAFTKKAVLQSDKTISLRFWNVKNENQNNYQDNQTILYEIEKAFAPGLDLMHKIEPRKGLKLHERLYINSDYEFSWPNLTDNYDEPKGTCYGLRYQIAILYNGTVSPCCLDAEGIINLGNIKNNEIQQIFNSDKAQKIYNGFLNNTRIETLCRKCRFIEKFN
ncbi:MAG: radical SAM/SPASM domain-containing protein [Bacteroidales bacterium]|jgi:radical SAM protein with 4Fe4S-binding SPASM domain